MKPSRFLYDCLLRSYNEIEGMGNFQHHYGYVHVYRSVEFPISRNENNRDYGGKKLEFAHLYNSNKSVSTTSQHSRMSRSNFCKILHIAFIEQFDAKWTDVQNASTLVDAFVLFG